MIIHLAADKLDGYLARKRGEATEFGYNLDMLVDIIFMVFMINSLLIKSSYLSEIIPRDWEFILIFVYTLFIPLGLWMAAQLITWQREKRIKFLHSRLKGLSSSLIFLIGTVLILNSVWSFSSQLIKFLIIFVLAGLSLDSFDLFWRTLKRPFSVYE